MTEEKMTGLAAFVNLRSEKKTKFLGNDLRIFKLTADQFAEVQALSKSVGEEAKETGKEPDGLAIVYAVVRMGAEGAKDITDEQFAQMPLDDLNKLCDEIFKHSGLAADAKGKG